MPVSDSPAMSADQKAAGTSLTCGVAAEGQWSLPLAGLHVFSLWALAVAQPLYDRLGPRLRYINDVGIEPSTLVLLTVVLSLLLPALLVAFEGLAGKLHGRLQRASHLLLVAVLAAVALLPVARRISVLPGLIAVLLGVFGGGVFAWAYCRWRWCRSLLTAASPGILLFPLWFLFMTPVSSVLFPASQPSAGEATVGRPAPVVLLVLDECCGLSLVNEHRQIDASLFPNFAALARRGTWFRNATTVHPFTDTVIASILTGKYPRECRRPTVQEHPVNLFTLLMATNQYEPVVFEPYTRLFPKEHDIAVTTVATLEDQLSTLARDLPLALGHHLIPSDFPFLVPDLPMVWFGLRGSRVPPEKMQGWFRYTPGTERAGQFEHFLRCVRSREKPALYFMHLVLPHLPWMYLPSGHSYKQERGTDWIPAGGLGSLGERWGPDPLVVAQAEQRCLLQLGYVDRLLGQLVERLEKEGLFDSALLILMADHGVSFATNHERRVPKEDTLGDILSIPLFIKTPGQRQGGPSDRNVESVDVLPTILDVLDYRPPVSTDGQSVLAPGPAKRQEKLFFIGTQPRTIPVDFPQGRATLQRFLRERDKLISFGLGPAPELAGQEISTLDVGSPSNLHCEWTYATSEVQDTPLSLLPCFVQGSVSPIPTPDRPVALAVAVNGTIAGVTRTYQLAEKPGEWSLLFPEKFLRVGKNEFTLYEVRKVSGGQTLHRVSTNLGPSMHLQ